MYYYNFNELFYLIEIKKKKIDNLINTYGWWNVHEDNLTGLNDGSIYRVILQHQDPLKYYSCFAKCSHIDKEIKFFMFDSNNNDFTFQIDLRFVIYCYEL